LLKEQNSHHDLMSSTKVFKAKKTKDRHYSKKFAAGKVVGMQNILPGIAETSNVVFFTDNTMQTELIELDVEPL